MMKAQNECRHCGEGFVSPKNLERHIDERHLSGGGANQSSINPAAVNQSRGGGAIAASSQSAASANTLAAAFQAPPLPR